MGKSTFVDYAFIIQPYLESLKEDNNPKIEVNWIYYSYEMDRVTKEFDFCTFFLYHDYKIFNVPLPKGQTRNGENTVKISSAYLRGRLTDDNNKQIKVHSEVKKLVKEIYENRIIPLFGQYTKAGKQIKEGLITFRDNRENPTGIYKDIYDIASKEGEIHYETYMKEKEMRRKIIGFTPKNPSKYHIVVIDHIRLLKQERGWMLKQTIDKMIDYMVMQRNILNWTFVPIIHTNRNLADINTMKFMGEYLYPSPESIKESGNLSEACDILITLFNPNDERYGLDKHFGLDLRDRYGDYLYPNLRTIHIAESRYCEYPQHFSVNMLGNVKSFKRLKVNR